MKNKLAPLCVVLSLASCGKDQTDRLFGNDSTTNGQGGDGPTDHVGDDDESSSGGNSSAGGSSPAAAGGRSSGGEQGSSESGGAPSGGNESGGSGGTIQTESCTENAALPLSGRFQELDETEHWFRANARGATHTIVLPGTASPDALPQLRVVRHVCNTGRLIEQDGEDRFSNVFVTESSGWKLCLGTLSFASLDEAKNNPLPDMSLLDGCFGNAWYELEEVP